MKEELLANGVDIKMHAKIEKILINNGKAYGVQFKDQTVLAKAIISNGNLRTTILKMAGEEHFSADFIEKLKKVRMNSSSCQVYIGIKEGETIPFIGDLVFTSTYPTFDTEKLLAMDITSRTFSVYYPEGRPQDENAKYAIVSSTNANWDDWANLSDEDYQKEKEKMIEETVQCLETYLPGIRSKIETIDAATPKTVKRYTHHEKGSSFGTKFEGLEISMGLHNEVKGLYHAGSVGIIMSGWLGAANYGVIQSNEVESYLYNQEKENNKIEENHAGL
jgi:phytoene dehydrogenase-like protein